MKSIPLIDIAAVIRSKNAGPYELTLDIIFKHQSDYEWVKKRKYFTKSRIARLYGIPSDRILKVIYFDPAFALKITMIRPMISGSPGDHDIYGAQQHAPLLKVRIPQSVLEPE